MNGTYVLIPPSGFDLSPFSLRSLFYPGIVRGESEVHNDDDGRSLASVLGSPRMGYSGLLIIIYITVKAERAVSMY